tara:strand:- start:234 stop:368 length:135 start_codon:yes stop_codon:yes gene_type:complete
MVALLSLISKLLDLLAEDFYSYLFLVAFLWHLPYNQVMNFLEQG